MSWGAQTKKPESSSSGLSRATQELLNDVMKERGLSNRAMQDVSESLRRGDGSWADRLNSSTATFKQPASKAKATVKVPKYSGGPHTPHMMPLPPASFSGKRMLPEIMKVAPPERDMWHGGVAGPNRDEEKDRLSKVMELGAKGAKDMEQRQRDKAEEAMQRDTRSRNVDAQEELVSQIVEEIRERREFLEEMQRSGKGPQYEATIKGEIAARMKELERLGLDVKSSRPKPVLNPNNLRLG